MTFKIQIVYQSSKVNEYFSVQLSRKFNDLLSQNNKSRNLRFNVLLSLKPQKAPFLMNSQLFTIIFWIWHKRILICPKKINPNLKFKIIIILQLDFTMSYYRDSPSKRSPYNRSPVKILESQRDFIEEQIALKNAYRSQAQNRRLLDEISLLQIRTRKIDQLEARCQALLKQNSLLTSENDQLSKQLSERRYEIQKIRSNSLQIQERDSIKSTQLGEINRSLEIEIELLKKERLESTKLYETHIQKLELMLEDKIKQSESLSLKCNDLINEKQISQIKFEQEKNKLKNLMTRTSYDMERQLEYTKEKQSTEKFVEIETLKKNYASQIALLEDQISKLKAANAYRNTQFESQLQENRNLKNRYEGEVKNLIAQNDSLRERILKLEQMNKTEVENIQQKYSNIHVKGTTSLKQQHQREIRLLLEEIDRQKWIINEKNSEIQHLIREKRDQQSSFKDRELSLVTEVETLKNKLAVQEAESAEKIHELINKINNINNKNLRDNENYFERVKNFQAKIKDLEREIDQKQSQYDTLKTNSNIRIQQLNGQLDEVEATLRRTNDALNESRERNKADLEQYQNYRNQSEEERARLSEKISELEVSLENQRERSQSLKGDLTSNDDLLRLEIKGLKETVKVLETKLSSEQQSHSKEMSDLSSNLREKMERLQATNKRMSEEVRASHANEIDTLRRRIEKLEREKQSMEEKLQEYIGYYGNLEKYFREPHKDAVFKEKASSSIYEVLDKTANTTIHIF